MSFDRRERLIVRTVRSGDSFEAVATNVISQRRMEGCEAAAGVLGSYAPQAGFGAEPQKKQDHFFESGLGCVIN